MPVMPFLVFLIFLLVMVLMIMTTVMSSIHIITEKQCTISNLLALIVPAFLAGFCACLTLLGILQQLLAWR